ncbi:class I SAM-dependent methyltransferase [Aliterella atlantica]|uniref:class I SAM-dependent methyltransferase n=1 Tax=Aliterella atlantica TaxID=1827278 RepID=UPI0006967B55|nr:class I SAM-dependent methyltransferase [Aliterella atlantica]
MEHREFYSVLHQFLVERHQKPFHLLDLRCGDAYNTTSALVGTPIQAYYGIDITQVAIALAGNNLAAIPCPKTLIESDFISLVPQLLKTHQKCFDVILASFSLHHLQLTQKDTFIGQLFQLLIQKVGIARNASGSAIASSTKATIIDANRCFKQKFLVRRLTSDK